MQMSSTSCVAVPDVLPEAETVTVIVYTSPEVKVKPLSVVMATVSALI